jgi:hypothetical protein
MGMNDVLSLNLENKKYFVFYWNNHLYQMKDLKAIFGPQLTTSIFYDLINNDNEESAVIVEEGTINYSVLDIDSSILDLLPDGNQTLIYEAMANDELEDYDKPLIYTNHFKCFNSFDLIKAMVEVNDSYFNFMLDDYINNHGAFFPIEIYFNNDNKEITIKNPFQINSSIEETLKLKEDLSNFYIEENHLGKEIDEYQKYKSTQLPNKGIIQLTEFVLNTEKENSVFDYENLFYKQLPSLVLLRSRDSLETNITAYQAETKICLEFAKKIYESISRELKYIKLIQERYL